MRSLLILASCSFIAADWPQFLGVNRDSTTKDKIPAWKDSPRLVWDADVGEAHSSPVVANGFVYAFYRKPIKNSENDLEVLAAFDQTSGKLVWEKSAERPIFATLFGKGPQSTPTLDEQRKRIFTLGNSGILTARDAKTGDSLWSKDTLKEYGAKNLKFGIATSPTVVGDRVIVMVGGKDGGIVAFDTATGRESWKVTSDPSSYSTPYLLEKEKQLVFLTGTNLRGITDEGREVWAHPFRDRANESSTMPIIVDGKLIASSITKGTVCLKVEGAKAEKVWEKPELTCFFSTPVAIGKHLYMINGVAGPSALYDPVVNLRCVDLATGKVEWDKPRVGRYHAALIRTGDDKLLMFDDNGYLTLFESNPNKYEELARSKVSGHTWAHHAVVDGRVYLRDDRKLYCFEIK